MTNDNDNRIELIGLNEFIQVTDAVRGLAKMADRALIEAADEIERLRKERDEAQVDQRLIDELWDRRTEMTDMKEQIKRLREERDEARRERDYLNGSTSAAANRILVEQIKEINKERDEARRLASEYACITEMGVRVFARNKGWDCFKDEADSNNKAFREGTLQ